MKSHRARRHRQPTRPTLRSIAAEREIEDIEKRTIQREQDRMLDWTTKEQEGSET
jgi:hypothetical protein